MASKRAAKKRAPEGPSIRGAVRVTDSKGRGRVLIEGDEEELETAGLSADDVARLQKKSVALGFKGSTVAEEKLEEVRAKNAEKRETEVRERREARGASKLAKLQGEPTEGAQGGDEQAEIDEEGPFEPGESPIILEPTSARKPPREK